MIIAITGKIGSGKHTAAKIFEAQGFAIINVDRLAHELYRRGSVLWHNLVQTFGKKILGKNYEIARVKLAKIIFNDTENLARLNQLIHPLLKTKIREKLAELIREKNRHNIVIVAALGDELDLKELSDKLVLIDAPLDKRIEWVRAQRGVSEETIQQIDAVQKTPQKVDFILENTGSLEEFQKRVEELKIALETA